MDFDIYDLETAVKTKLDWISALEAVYDSYILKTSGFPYAAFELADMDSEFADVCSNFTNITFNIVVVVNVWEDLPRPESKRILYKCLNEIKNAFDKDFTLWTGQVVRKTAMSASMGTFLWKEGDLVALTIPLQLTVNNDAVNFT